MTELQIKHSIKSNKGKLILVQGIRRIKKDGEWNGYSRAQDADIQNYFYLSLPVCNITFSISLFIISNCSFNAFLFLFFIPNH